MYCVSHPAGSGPRSCCKALRHIATFCEFYSLITNPKRTARAWSSVEAVWMISELLELPGLKILPTPAQAVTGLMELLKRHPSLAPIYLTFKSSPRCLPAVFNAFIRSMRGTS
jgi:hypothetical protein